jgi:hypothetical protein
MCGCGRGREEKLLAMTQAGEVDQVGEVMVRTLFPWRVHYRGRGMGCYGLDVVCHTGVRVLVAWSSVWQCWEVMNL